METALKKDIPELKKNFINIFNEDPQFTDIMFDNKLKTENTFIIRKNNIIAAMAYTMYFDCKIDKICGKCVYVYGVGTLAEYRGAGYMSQIMSGIYNYYKNKDYLFLYLVPAEPYLFKIYEKLGYKTVFYLNRRKLKITENKSFELLEGDFHNDYLEYIKKIPNVIIRSEKDNKLILNECKYNKINDSGFLYILNNEKALIKEAYIYNQEDLNDFISYLYQNGIKEAQIVTPSKDNIPYAMINIISDKINLRNFDDLSYTNLNFD